LRTRCGDFGAAELLARVRSSESSSKVDVPSSSTAGQAARLLRGGKPSANLA
jgi:hypothetical protein